MTVSLILQEVVPMPRTIEEVEWTIKKAHQGGLDGGHHMAAVATMRRMVMAANGARRAKATLSDVQEYALKNWRVPVGVEKSTA
jgi:hypothetical protein